MKSIDNARRCERHGSFWPTSDLPKWRVILPAAYFVAVAGLVVAVGLRLTARDVGDNARSNMILGGSQMGTFAIAIGASKRIAARVLALLTFLVFAGWMAVSC
jgi:hypothetical protein